MGRMDAMRRRKEVMVEGVIGSMDVLGGSRASEVDEREVEAAVTSWEARSVSAAACLGCVADSDNGASSIEWG